MKKLLCIILTSFLLFSMCACNEQQTDESAASEEESVPMPEKLTFNGSDISEYTVVYAETSGILKFRDIALEFVEYVKTNFGVELDLRSGNIPEKGDREIVLGYCINRPMCNEYNADYGYGGYKVVIKDDKVLLASNAPNGCYAAFKALCDKIAVSGDGALAEQEFEGSVDVIKVACVGDSITQGINSTKPTMTYPAYIQQMLGMDYYVLNAGMSGYSIVKTDEYAYWKTTQYKDAKEFEPDVVLFALGTNDCNPGQPYKNWDDPANNREELFIESTKELLDSFLDINPDCQIYICLPCTLHKVVNDQWNAPVWAKEVEEHAHPVLKQIAEDYGFDTVDLMPWSKEHPEVFPDGLHPKDESYKDYAQFIYDNIKDTIKKP